MIYLRIKEIYYLCKNFIEKECNFQHETASDRLTY